VTEATITLHAGDNRDSLRRLIDQGVRVHSVVCDPPYGLVSTAKRFGKEGAAAAKSNGATGVFKRASGGFMGKQWDASGIERDPEFWRLIHDILLPGGYVLAFSSPRTGHWQACAMEMAGFIMHPFFGWTYGCLDAETKCVTPTGCKDYTELNIGDDVICYDPSTGEYSVQPILEVVEYDYADTAYRLIGNHGEQVVSRNHRCIVERDGTEIFQFAETLECQARVPFLENVRDLQHALSMQGFEGGAETRMQQQVQRCDDGVGTNPNATGVEERSDVAVREVRNGKVDSRCVAEEAGQNVLQHVMSREVLCSQVAGAAFPNGARGVDGAKQSIVSEQNEGFEQSCMGWRCDASTEEGELRRGEDLQVRQLPHEFQSDGATRRLCDRVPTEGGRADWPTSDKIGSRSPHQSRSDRQSNSKLDVVCDQLGPQKVRTWEGHKTDLVRVVPFKYTGKVWCLRVPTGAFVASRGGVAFPTGNSGFPKAHNAAMAIDKELKVQGGRGEPKSAAHAGWIDRGAMRGEEGNEGWQRDWMADPEKVEANARKYVPGSPEAAQWEGWAYGAQSMKPALEPVYFGQKPFTEKNGALNLLKHGVGAVNIDGCRVPSPGEVITNHARGAESAISKGIFGDSSAQETHQTSGQSLGRHPANLILSPPENEYQLREDITLNERQELFRWLSENA